MPQPHRSTLLRGLLRGISVIENRSVPPDTVLPHVMYQDVDEAIAWLSKAFGFSEHYRYGDPTSGAQMHLGNAWIMLKTQSLTVFVDHLEAHFRRANAAGAKLLEDLHETVYGELQYAAEDLDGHHWLFSRHARDLGPDEWGAKVAHAACRVAELRRPRLCYLQIPALDVARSVAFYEEVFGWNIRHRNTSHPSFDDATGNVSGAWFNGQGVAGVLPSIWVDNIDATLAQAAAHGGIVVESPHPDFPGSTSWIAAFRDPAGNLIGLYQEGTR